MFKKLFITLFITISSAFTPLFAQYELEGYIKTAPLHQSTKNIMEAVQKLGLPPEQQILPYLFLGFLGYPEYPGLSRDENVSLFIYSTPDYSQYQYAILLKLDPKSPLRETFPQLGWTIKDYKDWTLLSQNENILESIQNPDSLIRVTQRPTASDIEAGYLFKQSRKHLAAFEQKLIDATSENGPIERDNMILGIELTMDILDRCHGGSVGLKFNEDSVDLHFAIKANPNTPEAALFSQDSGKPYTLAKYLKQGNTLSFAQSTNPKISQDYINFILSEASTKATPSSKKIIDELQEFSDKSFKNYDGITVSTLSVEQTGDTKETTIYGGDFDNDSAFTLMDESMKAFLNNFTQSFAANAGLKFNINIDRNVLQFNSTQLHRMTIEIDSTDLDLITDEIEQSKVTYFAAVDGSLITSTDSDEIKNYIEAVNSNNPVTGNVYNLLPQTDDTHFQFEMNSQSFLTATLKQSLANKDDPEFQAALASLRSKKFKNIQGSGNMKDRTFNMDINFPLGNIYKIQEIFKQLKPSIETAITDEKDYNANEEQIANTYDQR